MRYRVHDRGLRDVGAAGCLGLGRALGHARAQAGQVAQIAQGVDHALGLAARPGTVTVDVEPCAAVLHLQRKRDLTRPGAGRVCQLEPRSSRLERALQARGAQGAAAGLGLREQRRGRLGEHRRLALAGGGLFRPDRRLGGLRARLGGQPAHDQRRNQQHSQGDDEVVVVGDGQPVAGWDEEEVEGKDRRERCGDGCHLAAADGHERDGQHEHDAQAGRRGDVFEQRDQRGRGGDDGQDLPCNERRVLKAQPMSH